MTATQACSIVKQRRGELQIDPAMRVLSAERAIVLVAGLDRIAWLVTLTSRSSLVRVEIEDATGAVLNVTRSA